MGAVESLRNWNPDGRNIDAPPAYFLQRLYDFDAMLVLMPSRETPDAYVLGRRKQWGKGLTEAAIDAVYTKPDTKMAILNGTVPVCMVYKPVSGSWSPDGLLAKLRARDLWTMGGADAVADMLEEQEAAEKKATQKAIRDDIYNRSGAAWRSYQARTGQSNIQFNAMYPSKTAPETPVQVSESTVGLGRKRKRKPRKRPVTIGR